MEKPNQAEQGLEPDSSNHFLSQKPSLCSCLHAFVFNRNSIRDLRNGFCSKFCQTVAVKVVKFQFQQIVTLQWKNLH